MRGSTYLELLIAMSIVGVGLMVMAEQLVIGHTEIQSSANRAFAYRKAAAMLAEIQRGISSGDFEDASDLEALADGSSYNPRLSTLVDENGQLLPPDHLMSANIPLPGVLPATWAWSRRLEVTGIADRPDLRHLKVSVYRLDPQGKWHSLAHLSWIAAMSTAPFQRIKEYDLYILAINSMPSNWMSLGEARIALENAAGELENTENGLRLRMHWITKAGYGRDALYAPFVNRSSNAHDNAPYAYWYPGNTADPGTGEDLYDPELLEARIRTESTFENDYDAVDNSEPFALADQFNHCLRLPEARDLFQRRVAAGLENENEPPLQLLLEDLAADPDRYRNAIFLNLHGSALPMPPLRNYSDAAKDPQNHPGVRVVTHPAFLRTPRDPNQDSDHSDSRELEFRVYAYKTDPTSGPAVLSDPITLQIPGGDLTNAINASSNPSLLVRRLVGGINTSTGLPTGTGRNYESFDHTAGLPPLNSVASQPYEMSYEAGYTTTPFPHTWIKLYGTPLVCPQIFFKGLQSSDWLFGMEYIPSPVKSGGEFTEDLDDWGFDPKNTARWRIRIPVNSMVTEADTDRRISAITRIGENMNSGMAWPTQTQPHNLSITHSWWASSPEFVPYTERFQWNGDPRHNPYADLVAGGFSFPHGYNWHADDLNDNSDNVASDWPCFDAARLQDGFGAGSRSDVPRLMQLLRNGLQESNSVFVSAGGPLASFMPLGGEMALPGGPAAAPRSVTVPGSFFGMGGSRLASSMLCSDADPSVLAGEQVVMGNGSSDFWAKPWLGELWPDSEYTSILNDGNLPAGSGNGAFKRALRSQANLSGLPKGSRNENVDYGAEVGAEGAIAVMDSGTATQTFQHILPVTPPDASLTTEAASIADAVNEVLPTTLPCSSPFAADLPLSSPLPYFNYTDSYPKSLASVYESYYDSDQDQYAAGAIGLERLLDPATAFFCVLANTPAGPSYHEELASAALMLGLRTFHRAGEPGITEPVIQQPLVDLLEPTEGQIYKNPSSFLLRWDADFVRFDQQAFTAGYPVNYDPEAEYAYRLMFSADGGATWLELLTKQEGEVGQRPSNLALLINDSASGSESFLVTTDPSDFPEGEYLFRVEAYHQQRPLHMSHHQVRIRILR
ncbi:MAG: type IV pilus modification PilV family protein [Planctomycetota bacterium]